MVPDGSANMVQLRSHYFTGHVSVFTDFRHDLFHIRHRITQPFLTHALVRRSMHVDIYILHAKFIFNINLFSPIAIPIYRKVVKMFARVESIEYILVLVM